MERPVYKDEEILSEIAKGDLQAYEFLFRRNYEALYQYSAKITSAPQASEEIVQDIFVDLWTKRETLLITSSIANYLYKAVKNKSIDYLRAKSTRIQKDFTSEQAAENKSVSSLAELESKDLEDIIKKGIEELPKKCKQIFLLSREGDLSYDEIAHTLNISPKTVKAQVGIALKKLRTFLGQHWGEFIILIISFLHIFIDFF